MVFWTNTIKQYFWEKMEKVNKQTGVFSRLKSGFLATSNSLRSGISGIFSKDQRELIEEEWENFEQTLIEADMGVELSLGLTQTLRETSGIQSAKEVSNLIQSRLLDQFLKTDRRLCLAGTPSVVLFTGINGSGKTTSLAKIAQRLKNKNQSVLLAAGDTFRAAAVEQLQIWADRLELPLVKHKMGADPAAVAHDACEKAKAQKIDTVLIDTAGRLHNQVSLMEEIKKTVRVVKSRVGEDALECLLVLDGNAGQNSLVQAENFKSAIGINGIIITKLDGTAKGGIVVAIERELSLPVKFVGLGEGLNDLIPFSPETYVDALLDDT